MVNSRFGGASNNCLICWESARYMALNISVYVLFLLLFSTASCHDEPQECESDLFTGQMTMNINGLHWEGGAYALETSVLAVEGAYYHKPSCRLEQSFSVQIPAKGGVFAFNSAQDSLGNKSIPTFYYLDGDLLLGRYGIPTGRENGFIETLYDPVSRTITADFTVTLYLLQNYELPLDHPDSLVIVNGKVDAKFLK